jgi:hypothetical protein
MHDQRIAQVVPVVSIELAGQKENRLRPTVGVQRVEKILANSDLLHDGPVGIGQSAHWFSHHASAVQ